MTEILLFRDTETTGFKKGGALVQEGQARVCQVALILTDATGRPLQKFSTLIKPDGWLVSKFNVESCGITQEDCEQFGMAMSSVMRLYNRMASAATLLVAHNDDFDHGMFEIEDAYHGGVLPNKDHLTTKRFCTMKTNTHISGGKWPKLEATLQHYCGRSLGEDAHDAMFDTEACKDIYLAMQKEKAAA